MFEQAVEDTGDLEDVRDYAPHTRRVGSYSLDFEF
jgi:hypothetical protein